MSKRVFVIEPSPGVRAILEFALREEGHCTIGVEGAAEGMRRLLALGIETPDIVIMALSGNDKGERDLLNMLAYGRAYRNIPLILLTQPEYKLRLPSYRFTRPIHRLNRPFTVPRVLELVAEPGPLTGRAR